ncbi:kirola-like protein [Tanacetum coccineum]
MALAGTETPLTNQETKPSLIVLLVKVIHYQGRAAMWELGTVDRHKLDFFPYGKAKVAKEVIEAIDEAKRSVCFKGFIVSGGDILEAYKDFLITVHVDTHGEENLVTWTFHYEKLNENIPEPDGLMEFVLTVTKDIETHHLPKPE